MQLTWFCYGSSWLRDFGVLETLQVERDFGCCKNTEFLKYVGLLKLFRFYVVILMRVWGFCQPDANLPGKRNLN